jgi:hypothetical protein
MLDGALPLVQACREIQRPLDQLGLRHDPEFVVFVGIDSEADDYPFGLERRHWNKDVLAKLEEKMVAFEQHFRPYAEDACREVLRRLATSN